MNIQSISQLIQQSAKITAASQGKVEGFGSVMSAILTQANPVDGEVGSGIKQLILQAKQLIQTKDLDGLSELLNLDMEDFEKDVLSGEEISIDQIATALNIDLKELIQTISHLIGQTVETTESLSGNVWPLVESIEQKAPEIQRELLRSLKGDGLPVEQTINVIKLMKSLEFVLPKTDQTLKQEALTFSVKEIVSTIETAIVQSEKVSTLPEFRPIPKVVELKIDSLEGATLTNERMVNKTESHAITLPTVRSTQGEAFVKEFQSILNRSTFGQVGGTTKLLIKIYPENLGTVRIELVQKDGVLTARLLSSTSLGKELLDSQSHHLRQAFAQQNLSVERLEISQTLQDLSRHDRQQSFGHQFKQQEQKQQHSDQQENESEQVQESFLDLLMEVEV